MPLAVRLTIRSLILLPLMSAYLLAGNGLMWLADRVDPMGG